MLKLRRRVVVTGLGLVTPLGLGVSRVWKKLLDGESGITRVENTKELDYSSLPCQDMPGAPKDYRKPPNKGHFCPLFGGCPLVHGAVPRGSEPGQLNFRDHVSSSDQLKTSNDSMFALAAASEALSDANWFPHLQSEEDRERTGVSYGSHGIWSPRDLIELSDHLKRDLSNLNYREVSSYLFTRALVNMSAGHLSIRYQLHGPNHCVSTACATGLHVVGDSAAMIARGAADVMLAGASETMFHPLGIAALCRTRALSTQFNDEPERASRPFDAKRNGFVPSEGSGVVVLEELEHAQRRNAKIYAEILGYGLSSDAHGIIAPHPDGKGASNAMKGALADAGIEPEEVGCINAHATSTPLGDRIENRAFNAVFGGHAKNPLIYAPKGALGHMTGASGAAETILTVLSIKSGLVPPNLNLEEREPEFDLNYVTGEPATWTAEKGKRRIAVKNSFGFGGTNGSLCIGEYQQ